MVVICFPLLYLGYHWPSDILAGAALGISLMVVLGHLIGRTWIPDCVMRFTITHAPAFYVIAWLFAFEMASLFDIRSILMDVVRLTKALT